MREMKDSGIEWIGNIPEEWSVTKIKTHYKIGSGTTPKSDIPEYWDGDIVWVTPADFKTDDKYVECGHRNISREGFDASSLIVIPAGNIIFSKRAPIGQVVINAVDLCTNQGCLTLIPVDESDNRYYRYVMSIATEIFELVSGGATFKEISASSFGNVYFPKPQYKEQHKIADYLDSKCAQIDSIIAKQEAIIEKLKEYKLSVITEAVTKGLDPDVEMKDSGKEWFGRIPNDWECVISRFVLQNVGDINHYMPESVDEGYPYLMIRDLKDVTSEIDFESCKRISLEDYTELRKKIQPRNGDVIFARYATIGTVCYVDTNDDFLVSYACVTVKPDRIKLDGKYLYYFFKSIAFSEEANQYINSNTQGNIGIEALYRTRITVPSLYEQKEIISYLDEKCAEVNNITTNIRKRIGKLKEYKKSLIFEVVTGKREV